MLGSLSRWTTSKTTAQISDAEANQGVNHARTMHGESRPRALLRRQQGFGAAQHGCECVRSSATKSEADNRARGGRIPCGEDAIEWATLKGFPHSGFRSTLCRKMCVFCVLSEPCDLRS